MKKKLLLCMSLLFVCVLLVGCEEKKKEEKEPVDGGWSTVLEGNKQLLEDKVQTAFDKAVTDANKDYEAVALLGKQVVAGTNYMLLVKDKTSYKVIVVYNDLEDKAHISKVSNFNINKYVNEDISKDSTEVVGGWEVEVPGKGIMLEEKVQASFDKATEKISDYTFLPIGVLGKQLVAGYNYAVLSYGRGKDDSKDKDGIYLLTLYVDLQGNAEIISNAYVDLADFNK